MSKKVSYVPEGYHTVIPYLVVRGAADALEFYKTAFGATEVMRMEDGGRVGHAEIRIGDSHVMLADEHPEINIVGPQSIGGTGTSVMVYVEDVDAVFAAAVAAGATVEREVADQFYGDRIGGLVDPFGHRWYVATHVEDVAPDELERRAAASRS